MSKKTIWYGIEICCEWTEKGKVAPNIGELIYEMVFVLMGAFPKKKDCFPFLRECHSSRRDLSYFTVRSLLKLCTIKNSAKGVWTSPHYPLWYQVRDSRVTVKKGNLGSSPYSMWQKLFSKSPLIFNPCLVNVLGYTVKEFVNVTNWRILNGETSLNSLGYPRNVFIWVMGKENKKSEEYHVWEDVPKKFSGVLAWNSKDVLKSNLFQSW